GGGGVGGEQGGGPGVGVAWGGEVGGGVGKRGGAGLEGGGAGGDAQHLPRRPGEAVDPGGGPRMAGPVGEGEQGGHGSAEPVPDQAGGEGVAGGLVDEQEGTDGAAGGVGLDGEVGGDVDTHMRDVVEADLLGRDLVGAAVDVEETLDRRDAAPDQG